MSVSCPLSAKFSLPETPRSEGTGVYINEGLNLLPSPLQASTQTVCVVTMHAAESLVLPPPPTGTLLSIFFLTAKTCQGRHPAEPINHDFLRGPTFALPP